MLAPKVPAARLALADPAVPIAAGVRHLALPSGQSHLDGIANIAVVEAFAPRHRRLLLLCSRKKRL